MPNSNKSTVIYDRQGIGATNWNNIHNPAINLKVMQCSCKPATVKWFPFSLRLKGILKMERVYKTSNYYARIWQRYQELLEWYTLHIQLSCLTHFLIWILSSEKHQHNQWLSHSNTLTPPWRFPFWICRHPSLCSGACLVDNEGVKAM